MADQRPSKPHRSRRSRARAEARSESATAPAPGASRPDLAAAGSLPPSHASDPSASPEIDADRDGNASPCAIGRTARVEVEVEELIVDLEAVRADLVELQARRASLIAGIPESNQASARNLLHYLALHRREIRPLQRTWHAWASRRWAGPRAT